MASVDNLMSGLVGMYYLAGALGVLLLGYFYIFWDKRKDDSANKEDGQVGLKLTLFALILVGLGIALGGVNALVHYLASATKAGTPQLKASIGHLVSGAVVIGAVMFLFLPRTNSKDYPQAERFVLGAIAVLSGITAFMALDGFVSALLAGDAAGPWAGSEKSGNLATLLVNGGLMFFAVTRFGTLSGWTAPVRPQAPMMPPGGGFPPQGGYQQGGYQQGYQQGGYPPQGGMPPGGGYPPQGGMPPGGGYPPQGGGGYQPR